MAKQPSQPHMLLGKRLLIVTAHPDDESYLVSGTLFRNARLGGTNIVICATAGERGRAHLKHPASPAQLKKIRKAELKRVSDFLGVTHLHILNFSDGSVRSSRPTLRTRLEGYVQRYTPDAVISFGPDGVSGHHDHIAVGRVAESLAIKYQLPFYAFTPCPAIISDAESMKKRRKFGSYTKHINYRNPNIVIPAPRGVKLKALLHHQSQIEDNNPFLHLSPQAKTETLGHDYFYTKKALH